MASNDGVAEVLLELGQLPEKLQRRILAKVMRAGGVVVRDRARGKVRSVSGRLARSVRVSVIRRSGNLIARVSAGRNVSEDDPYYAIFVERGTKAHEIRPKGRKSLFLAGLFAEVVKHPGAKPEPFLQPALEESADTVLAAMQEKLVEELGLVRESRDL